MLWVSIIFCNLELRVAINVGWIKVYHPSIDIGLGSLYQIGLVYKLPIPKKIPLPYIFYFPVPLSIPGQPSITLANTHPIPIPRIFFGKK